MTSNFVVVVHVLLPICCHIGSGKPYLRGFVEDMLSLCGLINGCENLSVVIIRIQSIIRSSLKQKYKSKMY